MWSAVLILALTIDKSVELAQKEADELKEMIDAMAKRLLA
jgi:hypothetical protein